MTGPGDTIESLVRQAVLAQSAYHVPPSAGLVKLDAMENPYSLPPELQARWLQQLSSVQVNRYPDPSCTELKSSLYEVLQIPESSGLLLGNGSDELIQMLCMLVGGPGRTALAPVPTFSMYELISAFTATRFVGVPLQPDFALDGPALLAAIRAHQPACIFLAYPNNPTGNCFDDSIIEQVCSEATGLVVVDEAYHAFCGRSYLDRLGRFPNLVVLRTLSKSGMAGLRLGMLMAHPDWVLQLDKLRLPYNINSLTQVSAGFYLQHYQVLQQQANDIVTSRATMQQQLAAMKGISPFPSQANFILFRTRGDADALHTRLREQGVLIKNLHQPDSPLENCLRVTIGTEAENERFLAALASGIEGT